MTFGDSISTCFSKYATFSGRARRSEFWWFALFLAIVDLVLSFVSDIASGIWNLGTILPYAAVAWRRLHDIDRTGAWTLVPLVPLIAGFAIMTGVPFGAGIPPLPLGLFIVTGALCILNIVFWATKGTPRANRFGEDPLQ
ncbi:DUF805 domain-containing protein [Gymnodinialimonas sp.]